MADTLKLEVTWANGHTTNMQVTGTKHAGNLLRKNAHKINYARLHEFLTDGYGNRVPNTIAFDQNDLYGSAKLNALFDRNNTHYDLNKRH